MDITFRPDPWTPEKVIIQGHEIRGAGKEARSQAVYDLGNLVVAIGELFAAQAKAIDEIRQRLLVVESRLTTGETRTTQLANEMEKIRLNPVE